MALMPRIDPSSTWKLRAHGLGDQGEHLDTALDAHHDAQMKTTLTLDDDVADFLKMQSRLQGRPFNQVVNDVLRRDMAPGSQGPELPPYRTVPNRSGLVPGVDPRRLNRLNDQLEVEDFAVESGQ